MVTRRTVMKLLKKYGDAWANKDPDAILEVFTRNAKYYERVFENPFSGHSGIKKYWIDKVVGEQENISFKLLSVYMAGNTAIAEWEAKFHDKKRDIGIHMKEVAILEFRNDRISSFREYWDSEHTK